MVSLSNYTTYIKILNSFQKNNQEALTYKLLHKIVSTFLIKVEYLCDVIYTYIQITDSPIIERFWE